AQDPFSHVRGILAEPPRHQNQALSRVRSSMHFKQLKWTEVQALDLGHLIAVQPLGSIEQHSLHLPLSVDTDIITELAERVEKARPDKVVLLPTLWLGHSPHHRFFGSLSLDVRPYMDVIKGL